MVMPKHTLMMIIEHAGNISAVYPWTHLCGEDETHLFVMMEHTDGDPNTSADDPWTHLCDDDGAHLFG